MDGNRLDWPGLMRAGMGRLGLAPDVFWRLTPAELALMLGLESAAGAAPMTRARLAEMEQRLAQIGAIGRSKDD
ncbi:MAG: phage tail assembly chaperone [Paracoccus sp. (in: a-proteobacteria)]|nr:phage tail assembly chaperone [Paracoccus sp. (in: a-proteobacteria)]